MNNSNNNNNIIEIQRQQETLKRRWHDSFYTRLLTNNPTHTSSSSSSSLNIHQGRPMEGVDLVHGIVPSVTVVLEGRSICQRINLHSHANYHSLALALRQMFANTLNFEQQLDHNNNNNNINNYNNDNNNNNNNYNYNDNNNNNNGEVGELGHQKVDISNAIPGHVVAYEDLENDLLLAGDLHWKDFVRVAKRIRILPAKSGLRNTRSAKH